MSWADLPPGLWLVPVALWCAFWVCLLWPARRMPDAGRLTMLLLVVPPLLVAAARVLP